MAKISEDILHVVARDGVRGTAYRYRRIVPVDCQSAILTDKGQPRKNWVHTWRTGTALDLVRREAALLSARHDMVIAEARGHEIQQIARGILDGPPKDRYWLMNFMHEYDMTPKIRAIVATVEHGGTIPQTSLTLSEALVQDKANHGEGRSEKPFTAAVASFVDVIGDKDITTITRADVLDWITKKREGGWSGATVKRRLASLASMVGRTLRDLEIDKSNPFAKHKINGNGSTKKLPFNKAMLKKIDAYLASDSRLSHETRNIARIMKCTTAGPKEVGGLALADVSLDGEIPYIWLRDTEMRTLKNPLRERKLPLIGVALDAAKDAVERATARAGGKSPDDVQLFASYDRGPRGADVISTKLNAAIRAAGVPNSRRLTAYCFRHTIKQAMRSAGLLSHVQDRLMGHSGESATSAGYGSVDLELEELRDALRAALEFLGDVDDMQYSETERVK